jgi:hypothetical protein
MTKKKKICKVKSIDTPNSTIAVPGVIYEIKFTPGNESFTFHIPRPEESRN